MNWGSEAACDYDLRRNRERLLKELVEIGINLNKRMKERSEGEGGRPAFWVRWGTVIAIAVTAVLLLIVFGMIERMKGRF